MSSFDWRLFFLDHIVIKRDHEAIFHLMADALIDNRHVTFLIARCGFGSVRFLVPPAMGLYFVRISPVSITHQENHIEKAKLCRPVAFNLVDVYKFMSPQRVIALKLRENVDRLPGHGDRAKTSELQKPAPRSISRNKLRFHNNIPNSDIALERMAAWPNRG